MTVLPRALLALGEVERGARRAQLVVEVVAGRVGLLAARAVHPQRAHLVRARAKIRVGVRLGVRLGARARVEPRAGVRVSARARV